MNHLYMTEDRVHGLFRSLSIAMMKDSKGNCRGKITDMTDMPHGEDEIRDYMGAKHMIFDILNSSSVNESQYSEMGCLCEMLSWLVNVFRSSLKIRRLVVKKLIKFSV